MDTPILSGGAAAADADLIKNTTTKDFMRDVIDASREVPVWSISGRRGAAPAGN